MKALRTTTQHPPGSLLNPAFRYKKSSETDVAKTIARARREIERARASTPAAQLALPIGAALVRA
ncbi:hypothetical protein [Ottowia sp.]|uniref:hypothetical protein n=1 Tax=Ottowia sp. TaxID=1898956 RepID=UPI003A862B88